MATGRPCSRHVATSNHPGVTAVELTEEHKRAIVHMFANGASVSDLAEWYKVDRETIREVLRPHVQMTQEVRREK